MHESHALRLVEAYLRDYVYRDRGRPLDGKATVAHAALLLHMLEEAHTIPKRGRDVKPFLEALVRGKRILELGCREGTFLRFLQEHGAIVAGTTDDRRAAGARAKVGSDGRVYASTTEDAGTIRGLQTFNPHFILSFNLLDKSRWKEREFPLLRVYRTIHRLSGGATTVYVTPSHDFGPIAWAPRRVRQMRRIEGFAQSLKFPEGQPKPGKHETFRFEMNHIPPSKRRRTPEPAHAAR